MSIFDWLLYVDLADRLALLESEACFRSAISRAYYGVFGNIRNHLEMNNVSFNQANVHQEIIEWLKNQSNLGIKTIGWDLDFLRRERNRSDYDAKELFDKLRAKNSIKLARSIIQKAKIAKLI